MEKQPSLEDVVQALRNADAAGDTEAAQKLANIASSMTQKPREYGFGRAALQGLSMGFSDEIEARARAARGEGEYSQILAEIQSAKRQFEQENPMSSLATEIVGGIPTMFAGGLGLARTASMIPSLAARLSPRAIRYGGAAGSGAVTGAISGAGTAQPGERLSGAAGGAATGAILGPASEVGMQGVQSVGGKVKQVVKSTVGANQVADFKKRADEKLIQALQRDGFTPTQIIEKLKVAQRSGYKPEAIVDLGGENTQRLADIVAQYPGAAQIARDMAEERLSGQAGRITQDFQAALRFQGSASELADEIATKRTQMAAPLYQQAYQEGGVINDKRLDKFFEISAFKDAYKTARELAELDGVQLPVNIEDLKSLGGYDLRTLDYIKRGLDDVLYVRSIPTAGTGKQVLGRLKDKRREFVGIIDEVGPPSYKQARDMFAGQSEILDAIESGQKFTDLSPDQLSKMFGKMTQGEKEGFRAGVYESVKQNIAKGADGANVLRRVWNSPQKRDQLRIIVGEDNWGDLTNALAREKIIFQTGSRITGGSQTMPRQLAQREFEGVDELVPLVQQKGLVGGPVNYFLRSMTGPGQPTAEALAPTLFSTNFDKQMRELMRLQSVDQMLRRQAAIRGGAVGAGAGTQAGLLSE
jgi:hypothetical protein